uniref:Uncharacterized protein n=1 Tax=Chromera velia CCMP2878 TaxID=1169474 RepID=A0A0G4HDF9_9ALVE|eukprot:Cvel_26507.t1-p1 / transcript=Cvel_26507.t1 / gene=Cvel_26507 / organism=Chromera_velia_CCMP2878 / gene_product=hypothetical protein / transcript_product=hypothetical protein / location=Cvel_scaffold3163:373-2185(-) / protein_length=394 / sequence_SO=supercontig / SO=protein_coding / is_pseudo=false
MRGEGHGVSFSPPDGREGHTVGESDDDMNVNSNGDSSSSHEALKAPGPVVVIKVEDEEEDDEDEQERARGRGEEKHSSTHTMQGEGDKEEQEEEARVEGERGRADGRNAEDERKGHTEESLSGVSVRGGQPAASLGSLPLPASEDPPPLPAEAPPPLPPRDPPNLPSCITPPIPPPAAPTAPQQQSSSHRNPAEQPEASQWKADEATNDETQEAGYTLLMSALDDFLGPQEEEDSSSEVIPAQGQTAVNHSAAPGDASMPLSQVPPPDSLQGTHPSHSIQGTHPSHSLQGTHPSHSLQGTHPSNYLEGSVPFIEGQRGDVQGQGGQITAVEFQGTAFTPQMAGWDMIQQIVWTKRQSQGIGESGTALETGEMVALGIPGVWDVLADVQLFPSGL